MENNDQGGKPPVGGGAPGNPDASRQDMEIGVKTIDVPGYSGPERRKGERRIGALDRRELIRFEPDKAPRRSGHDRRGPKSVWDKRNEA